MILLLQNTDKRGNMSMQSKVNEAAKRKNRELFINQSTPNGRVFL